jgi:hypothetical protein
VRPFRAADYLALKPRAQTLGGIASADLRDPGDVGQCYETVGPAFTALDEEGVIAAGGIIDHWPGVGGLGTAWAVVGERVERHAGLDLFWAIRGRFHAMVKDLRLRRVEAAVLYEWERGERLMRLLGFALAIVKPLYGPRGETYGEWVLYPQEQP